MYTHTNVGVDNLNGAVATTEITVEWDEAVSPSGCGPVFYYIVTAVNLADASDMITIETLENVTEVSNLRNCTSYDISVAAVNRAGTGPSSMVTVPTSECSEGT